LPLYADGVRKIRHNLAQAESGLRPRIVKIGFFTPEQLTQINKARAATGFPLLLPEIVFHGAHLHKGRCVRDGYTIDQVLEQIQSAFSDSSEVNFRLHHRSCAIPIREWTTTGTWYKTKRYSNAPAGIRMRIYFQ